MNVDVSSEIIIQRPRDEVASYAANPANAPTWYVNIKTVEWETPPPVRVGSRIVFVAHFLGRRLAYTYEVTEQVLPDRVVMRTSQGPFPMETTYTWEPTSGGGTRMTLRNRGKPTGFSVLVAPFMSWAIGHANRKDLVALKQLLESGRAESAE